MMSEELKAFLVSNRIDEETWKASGCDWADLSAIRSDHVHQSSLLSETAILYVNLIQKISGVHSVRWRVKNPDHLLEKIIRKKAAAEEKYANIRADNYHEIVTDLIGIRALHLFKDDCFEINKEIASKWSPVEKPVAYIRNGDPVGLVKKYMDHGLEVKEHPAGYRSVHHVISSQPTNRKIYAEIQIRTIFEEGWSEIDHKIRYPNFSSNDLVDYFLTIFNRLAGSADEMGSFVTGLAASIKDSQLQIFQASKERDESLRSMEELLAQLTELKQQDQESKETITKLQEQVVKMKQHSLMDDAFNLVDLEKSQKIEASFKRLQDIAAQYAVKHREQTSLTSSLRIPTHPKKK